MSYLPNNYDPATMAVISIRLPNGDHAFAPMQKKPESNVYDLLFPNQLLVWKSRQGGAKNAKN